MHKIISPDTVKQICSIVHSYKKSITIEIMDVLKQRGSTDCGLFALAFATSLCLGELPSERRYIQASLRAHLSDCFKSGNLSSRQSFPSVNRRKVPDNLIQKTMVIPVFCYCRMPEEGNMVECCQCAEWYHDKCEVIDQEVWEKEDADWVCKSLQAKTRK